MVLIPAYTGKDKEFFILVTSLKQVRLSLFLDNCDNFVELFHNSC